MQAAQHSSSNKLPLEEEKVIDSGDGDGEAGPNRPVTRQAQSPLTPCIFIKANMEDDQEGKKDGGQPGGKKDECRWTLLLS
eukprot:1156978-Pelagomonas_calceolata.AAC.7